MGCPSLTVGDLKTVVRELFNDASSCFSYSDSEASLSLPAFFLALKMHVVSPSDSVVTTTHLG